MVIPESKKSGSRLLLAGIVLSFLAKIHSNVIRDKTDFKGLLTQIEENKVSYEATLRLYELIMQYLNTGKEQSLMEHQEGGIKVFFWDFVIKKHLKSCRKVHCFCNKYPEKKAFTRKQKEWFLIEIMGLWM